MSMEAYEGPAELYINGRLLAEAKSCTVRFRGNNNAVNTMRKGFAGKSDGVRTTEITIENAVPRKGYEFDFVDYVQTGKYVNVVYRSGGRRHNIQAYVEDAELTNATDRDAGFNVTLTGGRPVSRGG